MGVALFAERRLRVLKHQSGLTADMGAVYGVHLANQALPLITIPYLSRVLGAETWGLVAMAQSFAACGGLLVDYGFLYSATRQIAQANTDSEVQEIIAGVSGAKLLLGCGALALASVAYFAIPPFHRFPVLFWSATGSEIIKALLPVYFFYGVKRISTASVFDIFARAATTAGILLFVQGPEHAWRIFAFSGAASFTALLAAHAILFKHYSPRLPRLRESFRTIREGWAMFLFRGSHTVYTAGNAFILGLFAAPQAVGYYAGAEKISAAALGLLSPFSTVLYPRAAGLVRTSFDKAARLTAKSLAVVGTASLLLMFALWFGASLIVPVVLGHGFDSSAGVLRILSLRAPLIALVNVLGFQWLLALGFERQFQKITLAALAVNSVLAAILAPRFSYSGMAWSVLVSQLAAVIGIYVVLQQRGLNPLRAHTRESYA